MQHRLWTFRDFKIKRFKNRNTLSVLSNGSCLLPPGIIAIAEINEAINSGDHQQTLAALLLPTAKLMGVNPDIAKHYHDVLQYTKQLLCQVL